MICWSGNVYILIKVWRGKPFNSSITNSVNSVKNFRQQQELERMATAFDASWEEQLWRIRVEQEVFSCQRADVNTLRNELKHLSQVCDFFVDDYLNSTLNIQFQCTEIF